MVIPAFISHYSLGCSALTVEKESEIKDNAPVSILAIAKTHKENPFLIIENDMASYWKLYKNCAAMDLQYIFGIKLTVCADLKDKSDESKKTESNVIFLFKNSDSYYKFVPIYTLAATEGMLAGKKRLDWKTLKERWSDDFELIFPFYSSFLAKNLLRYDHSSISDIGGIKASFFLEEHSMPFDNLISGAVKNYCESSGYPILESHKVAYYKDSDAMNLLTIKCMRNRKGGMTNTWEKPNLDHFSSSSFSYESYCKRVGKTLC